MQNTLCYVFIAFSATWKKFDLIWFDKCENGQNFSDLAIEIQKEYLSYFISKCMKPKESLMCQ